MRIARFVILLVCLAALSGCEAVRLYTQSVKRAFSPQSRGYQAPQEYSQQQKDRVCDTYGC
jgi:hypothetical protein